ncbi:MAG: PPOX class F420-dependent oxidoreductase [SAR202 cluster bacterium]|jgi:PPOX class probable F420-dependent enzyme|nr:PPOX class F420-dependent oxidoreductase [SAR202 cluster bacterium]MDP7224462.1 PPOX class F420-dependent oxidoreductase [SAR202 cluster bacterium]MDP7413276.1 PPOX class F420-dependent oxidoreductase [SAR202 cluster bacterium]
MSSTPISAENRAKLAEFLEPSRIVVVATIGRNGMPQLTPNWYWFDGETISISTTKNRVKYRNLSRDHRMSVCIYSEPRAADYAMVTGTVTISDDESIWPTTRKIIERYADPDRIERQLTEMRTQGRVILSLTPATVAFRW